ncbi:MAG: phosphatase, partial [Bacteroidaceae bacterium]|nr:phosphatase [Bacteroidaceae bacterium]
MKVFATIYVGSLEIAMKVFQVKKGSGLTELDCLRMPTDLIHDVIDTKKISTEAADRICHVLLDMKRIMNSYKVDSYEVYGNATLKKAPNIFFVLDQIKLKTGFEVKLITNSEQRFLGYQAIASMPDFDEMVKDSALLVDIGGVSLQITYVS